ncbi:MAG: hypothetical protein OEY50_07705 [Nitrospinota bacterium]|nr:hypothetical protein [Nitrospinota bacterium]MDH5677361.1 hypothetical protein [Nitrospinota bacterium]MDH5756099.1 hypothetical protein [Nitrospinota bacterium]
MTRSHFVDSADKLNTVEFVPFMVGITWLLISVVGLAITLGFVVYTLAM